ncbi:arylsulfatase [Brachybacterium vulturis]|uniref:Arylsulfatase n=1 Tax=Brachybacterium vulturis TaxID=2017484 RepID=A0A291GJU3_9MICO|nr:arylsulfatase [Brachybacterium vulturis]
MTPVSAPTGDADLPDIVVILADDLGHADLSCYGATAFSTPALDALAARGLRFTDAHAASAVCTPSRYALLTGRHPWRSPLRSAVLGGTDGALIAEDVPTLAGTLRERGYLTAAIGKWHLGLDWQLRDGTRRRIAPEAGFRPSMEADGWDVDFTEPFENGPLERGFDHFVGISGSLDMPPYCILSGDRAETVPTEEKTPRVTSQRPGPAAPGWVDADVDPRFAREAVDWLRRTTPVGPQDPPRFLYLATAAPHRPCLPPEEHRGRSGIGPRADAILMIDDIVDRVEAALENSSRPCLVVFASDNGAPTCYPEDGALEDHLPNGALRGQKADVYDGGHRVPLIVSGDGLPARVDERLVSLLDLFPSLLAHVEAIAEAQRAPRRPGERAVLDLDGAADLLRPSSGPSRVVGATAFDGSLVLMREKETACFSTGSGGFSEPVGVPTRTDGEEGQFYDRAADPRQSTDLWEAAGARRREMVAQFIDETGYGDLP